MASVALLISDFGPNESQCLSLLHRTLSMSMREIQESAASSRPIIEKKLFDRHDPSFAGRLSKLLQDLDALGCLWTAVELLDGQTWSPAEDYYKIDAARIRAMIDDRERSIDEQWRSGEAEGEG